MLGKVMRCGYGLLGLVMAVGMEQATGQTVDVEQPYTITLGKYDLSSTGGGGMRYGIWLSLGGSDTPQLFEFDTGGEGLYAAYSADAAWWGPDVQSETTAINKNFGSGLNYTGNVAQTSVTFYDAVTKAQVLATPTATYNVGQSTNIANTNTNEAFWPPQVVAEMPSAPVYETFYGDFGLSLKKGDHSIENVFAQLTYGGSVTAGYTVNLGANGSQPSIQVGLTAADLTNPDTVWFTMAAGGDNFAHSDLATYAAEVISASLFLSVPGTPPQVLDLGLNLDTGNGSPGIPYQQGSDDERVLRPLSNENVYGDLTSLKDGLQLMLVGTDANGNTMTLDQFTTGSDYGTNFVWEEARSDGGATYMNIGQLLFEKYAVTYDLANGQLGLTPYTVPEPGTGALALLGAAGALAAWRFNRRS